MPVVVLDIEAVKDPATYTPPEPEKPAVIREFHPAGKSAPYGPDLGRQSHWLMPRETDHFPTAFAWRPIVIGFVRWADAHDTRERDDVPVSVGAIDVADTNARAEPVVHERRLLQRFGAGMSSRPDLVTWSGRRFDLPVLLMRSMRHGIPCPWFYANRDMRYRFSEAGHCDLADQMSDYGASPAMSLDGAAKLIGLPGKFGDIDGAGVADAFAAGRMAEVTAYCMADAVQTSFLWLRWQWLKGEWGTDEYQVRARQLLAACEADERLRGLCERIDRTILLMESA